MEAALVMFGINWVTSRVLNEVEDVIFEVFFEACVLYCRSLTPGHSHSILEVFMYFLRFFCSISYSIFNLPLSTKCEGNKYVFWLHI